ncbi:MAG: hypothetical protein JSS07_10060 [Proteobacteria bacterium]|nr:hypothetical protein [Pseudomonadota bacterium]
MITFYIKLPNNQSKQVRMYPTATIAELKQKIFQQEGIPVENQSIPHAGRMLEDNITLESSGILRGPYIKVINYVPPAPSSATASVTPTIAPKINVPSATNEPIPSEFEISVNVRFNGNTTLIKIDKRENGAYLKQKIFEQMGIPVANQAIIVAGNVMKDDTKLDKMGAIHLTDLLLLVENTKIETVTATSTAAPIVRFAPTQSKSSSSNSNNASSNSNTSSNSNASSNSSPSSAQLLLNKKLFWIVHYIPQTKDDFYKLRFDSEFFSINGIEHKADNIGNIFSAYKKRLTRNQENFIATQIEEKVCLALVAVPDLTYVKAESEDLYNKEVETFFHPECQTLGKQISVDLIFAFDSSTYTIAINPKYQLVITKGNVLERSYQELNTIVQQYINSFFTQNKNEKYELIYSQIKDGGFTNETLHNIKVRCGSKLNDTQISQIVEYVKLTFRNTIKDAKNQQQLKTIESAFWKIINNESLSAEEKAEASEFALTEPAHFARLLRGYESINLPLVPEIKKFYYACLSHCASIIKSQITDTLQIVEPIPVNPPTRTTTTTTTTNSATTSSSATTTTTTTTSATTTTTSITSSGGGSSGIVNTDNRPNNNTANNNNGNALYAAFTLIFNSLLSNTSQAGSAATPLGNAPGAGSKRQREGDEDFQPIRTQPFLSSNFLNSNSSSANGSLANSSSAASNEPNNKFLFIAQDFLDGFYIPSSDIISPDDLVISTNEGYVNVLKSGVTIINNLINLVSEHNYKIVLHSLSNESEQDEVIEKLKLACRNKGFEFPIHAMAVYDTNKYKNVSSANPVIETRTDGIKRVCWGTKIIVNQKMVAEGKDKLRRAMEKALNIQNNDRKLHTVIEKELVTPVAEQEGYQVIMVTDEQTFAQAVQKIVDTQQRQNTRVASIAM